MARRRGILVRAEARRGRKRWLKYKRFPIEKVDKKNVTGRVSFGDEFRGQTVSVSEIEFGTLYVVAERWILGCILGFMHAKNHFPTHCCSAPLS